MPKRFHLGWFTNFITDEWNKPFASGGTPWTGDFYIKMAQAMERACFDYIMLEDTLMISDSYGGTMEAYLKHAIAVPKHDPAPLAALIGATRARWAWSRPCRRWAIRRSCWRGSARRSITSARAGLAGTS